MNPENRFPAALWLRAPPLASKILSERLVHSPRDWMGEGVSPQLHAAAWPTRRGAEIGGSQNVDIGRLLIEIERPSCNSVRSDLIFYLLPPVHVKDAKHAALWEPPYDFGAHLRTCLCRGKVGGFKDDYNLDVG